MDQQLEYRSVKLVAGVFDRLARYQEAYAKQEGRPVTVSEAIQNLLKSADETKQLSDYQVRLARQEGRQVTVSEVMQHLIRVADGFRQASRISSNKDYVVALERALATVAPQDTVVLVTRRFTSFEDERIQDLLKKVAGISDRGCEIFISENATQKMKESLAALEDKYSRVIVWVYEESQASARFPFEKRYLFVVNKAEVCIEGEENGERKGWYYSGSTPDYDVQAIQTLRWKRLVDQLMGETVANLNQAATDTRNRGQLGIVE